MPDDPEYAAVELPRRKEQTDQPYALAALMVGVIVLLAAKLIVRTWPSWPFWGAAALTGTFIYNILIIVRPRLPLMLMAVAAAELGLLLSMPIVSLFVTPWGNPSELGRFLSHLISAGVLGAFLAWALSVYRYPSLVIAINFLLMFVLVGFGYFLRTT
jgi:drug/metabolite transporter (DMT)-like permease